MFSVLLFSSTFFLCMCFTAESFLSYFFVKWRILFFCYAMNSRYIFTRSDEKKKYFSIGIFSVEIVAKHTGIQHSFFYRTDCHRKYFVWKKRTYLISHLWSYSILIILASPSPILTEIKFQEFAITHTHIVRCGCNEKFYLLTVTAWCQK